MRRWPAWVSCAGPDPAGAPAGLPNAVLQSAYRAGAAAEGKGLVRAAFRAFQEDFAQLLYK